MKNIIFIAPILFSSFLYGCNSDIDAIKNGRLNAYPEYTIGQAFDNRDMCESTDWESIKDKRDRTIIRYTCHMKGVKESYLEEGEKLISEAKNKDSQKKYQTEIDSWQQKIPEAEASIEKITKETKKTLTLDVIKKPFDEKISCLEDYTKEIERKIRASSGYVDIGYNPCEENRYADDYEKPPKLRITDAQNILLIYKEKELPKLVKKKEEAIDYFPSTLRQTISAKTRDLETSINVMKSDIDYNKKKINEENNSDESKMKQGKFLIDSYKTADVYQTVDWLLLEDGTIMITSSSLHKKYPGEDEYEVSEFPDWKIKYVIISAYKNSPKSFLNYENAIRNQELIDVFR